MKLEEIFTKEYIDITLPVNAIFDRIDRKRALYYLHFFDKEEVEKRRERRKALFPQLYQKGNRPG